MAVVDVEEMRAYLNMRDDSHDDDLTVRIEEAQAAIEEKVGPLGPVEVTVRVAPVNGLLRLKIAPAIDLISITPADGASVAIGGLHLDTAAAVVARNDGTALTARYYDVIYTAGREECPANLKLAVKELVRHLWGASKRAGAGRPGSQPSDATSNTIPGAAFLFPFRVEQLLVDELDDGFA